MSIAFWCLLVAGLAPIAVVMIAKADRNLDVANFRDMHLTQTGLRKRSLWRASQLASTRNHS